MRFRWLPSAIALSLLIAGMTMLPATVQAAPGDVCNVQADCAGGDACFARVCRARCGGVFPACAAPLRCTPAQGAVRYCRVRGAEGADCTDDEDCATTTFCNTDEPEPVCNAKRANGEVCTNQRQCTGGGCNAGLCVTRCRGFGERCAGGFGNCCEGPAACVVHFGDGSFRSLRYRIEKYGISDPNPEENE